MEKYLIQTSPNYNHQPASLIAADISSVCVCVCIWQLGGVIRVHGAVWTRAKFSQWDRACAECCSHEHSHLHEKNLPSWAEPSWRTPVICGLKKEEAEEPQLDDGFLWSLWKIPAASLCVPDLSHVCVQVATAWIKITSFFFWVVLD